MKHRGEVLNKIVTQLNISKTKLVKRVGYDRTTYYSHIKKEDLDYAILWAYGKAIPYDFTKDFPEMKEHIPEYTKEITDFEEMKADRDKWKDKYYELLEKYHGLLENRDKKDR